MSKVDDYKNLLRASVKYAAKTFSDDLIRELHKQNQGISVRRGNVSDYKLGNYHVMFANSCSHTHSKQNIKRAFSLPTQVEFIVSEDGVLEIPSLNAILGHTIFPEAVKSDGTIDIDDFVMFNIADRTNTRTVTITGQFVGKIVSGKVDVSIFDDGSETESVSSKFIGEILNKSSI